MPGAETLGFLQRGEGRRNSPACPITGTAACTKSSGQTSGPEIGIFYWIYVRIFWMIESWVLASSRFSFSILSTISENGWERR